jgi:hypothetical protein
MSMDIAGHNESTAGTPRRLDLSRSRATDTPEPDLGEAQDLRQLEHSPRRTRAAVTLSTDLISEVQMRVHRDDVKPVLSGQRRCQHRRDRVIAAEDERDRPFSDDLSQCAPGALGVVATIPERECDIATIDHPERVAVEKRSTEIKVVVVELVNEHLACGAHSCRSARQFALLIVERVGNAMRYAENRSQRLRAHVHVCRRKIEEAHAFGHGRA